MHKNDMRKIIIFLVVLLLSFCFTSCKDNGENGDDPVIDDNGNDEKINPDDVVIENIDNGTRKEKALDMLDDEEFSAGSFISTYTFDYVFLSAKDNDGNLINDIFDYPSYQDGKKYEDCYYDTEEAKEVRNSVYSDMQYLKSQLLNGAFVNYGYAKDMDFLEFCKDLFSSYYGFEINGLNDLSIYFLYQELMDRFYNQVIAVDNISELVIKINYANQIDEYFYATGYHLLICKKENGSLSYLDNWSDEDKEKAQELYDKILSIIKKIDNYEDKEELENNGYNVYDFCVKLSDLFSNANFSEVGDALTFYFGLDNLIGNDFESYYLDNYSVICEQLEVEPGVMVPEFEDGVRRIINSVLDELIENIKIERDIYFDEAIISQFGYHFYVNKVISLENIYTEGDFLKLPSKEHFAMFLDEYRNLNNADYVSPLKLLKDYLKAVKENDNDKINKSLSDIYEFAKELKLKSLSDLNIGNVKEEFIDKYLKTYTNYNYLLAENGEDFDLDSLENSININHGIEAFCIGVYNQYAGSYYYMYKILMDTKEELRKIDLKDRKESIEEMLTYYNDGYTRELDLIIINSKHEYNRGLLEKINKDLFDELNEYFSNYSDLEE